MGFLANFAIALVLAIAWSFYLLDRLAPILVGLSGRPTAGWTCQRQIVSLAGLVASWRGAHGMARQRIAWILLSLGFNFGISDLYSRAGPGRHRLRRDVALNLAVEIWSPRR